MLSLRLGLELGGWGGPTLSGRDFEVKLGGDGAEMLHVWKVLVSSEIRERLLCC